MKHSSLAHANHLLLFPVFIQRKYEEWIICSLLVRWSQLHVCSNLMMMLIMKLLPHLKTIFSNNTSRRVLSTFSHDYSIVNERLSREQIYCLFPYLKKDGQLTDFHERHKQMFTVSDHMFSIHWEFHS